MKKIIMFVLCFMCLFGSVTVKAEEIDNSLNDGDSNVGEVTPDEDPDSQNPDSEPDVPTVTEVPVESDEEQNNEMPAEILEEELNTTNTNTNTYNNASTSKIGTYSYTTNSTTNNEVSVKISNIDSSTGKLLAGSKLQIQDEDGEILCEWVTTEEEYIIDDLEEGKYYLVVLNSAEGYESKNEKIEFAVNYDEEELKIEVENVPVVKVPDTLSSGSILLLSIAMIDIAIGIWIIVYVKKNKVKE